MVLNFNSTGGFGQAVYGNTSSQHAGQNGAIAQSNPSMQGGRRNNRRSQRNNRRRNQNGGRRSRRNQQRGGK